MCGILYPYVNLNNCDLVSLSGVFAKMVRIMEISISPEKINFVQENHSMEILSSKNTQERRRRSSTEYRINTTTIFPC